MTILLFLYIHVFLFLGVLGFFLEIWGKKELREEEEEEGGGGGGGGGILDVRRGMYIYIYVGVGVEGVEWMEGKVR